MYLSSCFIFSLLYFAQANVNLNSPPEVSTPLGKVQGQWKTTYDGRQYAAFEGIPYAKPPLGSLRFEEPQPVEPWIGVWNATQLYICPQLDLKSTIPAIGNEDCLYVNVFVPVTYQQELDVVVHIHGGAFMFGSASHFINPKYVMDRDLIFVTLNYRLGPLGFLSTEDEVVPGNNGLKDQVQALKWIQQNIASFGGNPDSVTITGFSAGAASVHYHYLSPLSRGLFQKGMSLSGVSTNHWAVSEEGFGNAQKLAGLVGCPTSKSKYLVECLKNRPATLLVEQTKYVYEFGKAPGCLFNPIVEKKGSNPFISDHPYKLLKKKKALDVPWIVSVTRNEGLLLNAIFLDNLQEMDERWKNIAPYVLDFRQFLNRKDIPNKIKEFYLGDESFNTNNLDKFEKMATDFMFIINSEATAKLQAKATKSPVYFYLFNYDKGENGFLNLYSSGDRLPGVSHGDDIIYFFGGPILKDLSETDTRLKNACLDMLYSYAKYGVPSFKGVEWLPNDGEELTYLNITGPDDITLRTTNDLTSTRRFWEDLGLTENELVKDEL